MPSIQTYFFFKNIRRFITTRILHSINWNRPSVQSKHIYWSIYAYSSLFHVMKNSKPSLFKRIAKTKMNNFCWQVFCTLCFTSILISVICCLEKQKHLVRWSLHVVWRKIDIMFEKEISSNTTKKVMPE